MTFSIGEALLQEKLISACDELLKNDHSSK